MAKNKIVPIISFIIIIALFLLFTTLSVYTDAFVFDEILHSYVSLLFVLMILRWVYKGFANQLTGSLKKAFIWCAIVVILETVVVDGVRYFLKGVSTILFLPACIPVCFMIIALFSYKDTGENKRLKKGWIYIIGIPLLLLSLYFEVLSFIHN